MLKINIRMRYDRKIDARLGKKVSVLILDATKITKKYKCVYLDW